MANFGDINSSLALGASQSVRRNSGDSAFEAFTPLTAATGVTAIVGTSNQVLANGTSGSAQVGSVILTLPQSIATTSTPQFARMGLGAAADATALLYGLKAGIGATSTDGYVLENTTAAADGAQQWSPRLRFTGRGWKNSATTGSQTVDWIVENVPEQNVMFPGPPRSNLTFSSQINGGGYTARVTFGDAGQIRSAGAIFSDNVTITGISSVLTLSNALSVPNGGTGLTSVAQGDILYSSSSNVLTSLAKNTSATRYLSNTGTSNNPAWAQVDLTNGVTGSLPAANITKADLAGTANQVILSASGTGVLVGSTNITLSLPQSIATSSTPQFARLGLGTAAGSTALITLAAISGFDITTTGTENLDITTAASTGGGLGLSSRNGTGIFVDTSNFVGIGTTSPATLLHLNTTSGSSNTLLTIESDIDAVGEYDEVKFKIISGLQFSSIRNYIHAANTGAIAFSATSDNGSSLTEVMRLLGSGNVGIGNTAPQVSLHVGTAGLPFTNSAKAIIAIAVTGEATGLELTNSATAANNNAISLAFVPRGLNDTTTAKIVANAAAGATSPNTDLDFYTYGGGALTSKVTIYSDGGITLGAATGASKGAGTLNASADIYKNGTAYTNPDYVLEHWATGKIIKYADKEGASTYTGLLPLHEVKAFTKQNYHLPRFGQRAEHGIFSGGDSMLASLEEAYLYIFQLEERIAKLEQ